MTYKHLLQEEVSISKEKPAREIHYAMSGIRTLQTPEYIKAVGDLKSEIRLQLCDLIDIANYLPTQFSFSTRAEGLQQIKLFFARSFKDDNDYEGITYKDVSFISLLAIADIITKRAILSK